MVSPAALNAAINEDVGIPSIPIIIITTSAYSINLIRDRRNFKTIHKAIEAAVVTDAEVLEEKETKKEKSKKDKE